MTDDRADEGTSARPPATRTIANVNRSDAKTEINANTSGIGSWQMAVSTKVPVHVSRPPLPAQ